SDLQEALVEQSGVRRCGVRRGGGRGLGGVIGCCGHDLMVSRGVWTPAPAPRPPQMLRGGWMRTPADDIPWVHVSRPDRSRECAPCAPALRIRRSPAVPMPRRAHPDDAGLDLASAEEVEIPAGGRALVDTGLAVALPEGTVGMVCPRSGLAARHGITVLNGPGVVDA